MSDSLILSLLINQIDEYMWGYEA